jgi:hypothetical protein
LLEGAAQDHDHGAQMARLLVIFQRLADMEEGRSAATQVDSMWLAFYFTFFK